MRARFTYDAFGSLLSVTDDHSNPLFAATYDYGIGAFQRTITDMDLGGRSYVYNALGELTSGSDAKGQSFLMSYDALSRPLTRDENEGRVEFIYGNAAANHNLGRLQSMNSPGYTEQFTYDGLGRLSNRHIVTDQAYDYDYSYDVTTGLPDTLTYPTSTSGGRLKLQYGYQNGVLQQVKDYNSSTVFWYANQTNSRGQVTQQTLGNGIVSNLSFDAITGWLDNIQSGLGGGTGVQNASYQYDRVGNVTQRQNNRLGLTEDVHYDSLHRLSYSQLGGATNLSLTYDYMGNITSRSDIASGAAWTYDSVKKHAVRTAGDSSHTYTYDNNGNAITRNGYGITWTSYDYPSVINGPNKSMTFSYGPDRQRFKQVYTNGSTLETTMYVGGMLEKVTAGGVTDWRHYVSANGQTVAIVSRLSTGTNTTRYVLEDQQGSIAEVIGTGTSDTFSESFTPFGARRDAATWSGSCNCTDLGKMKGVTRRGYTGHEAIGGQSLGLNHMNGRVQDAITGRFLSPDPYVTEPGNTQGFNRYSYVNNNPLSYTDPSGFAPADGSPDDGDNRACTGNFCINVHIPFLCEDWTCSRGIQRGLVPISLADNERRASRYIQFESQGAATAEARKLGASTGPTSTVDGVWGFVDGLLRGFIDRTLDLAPSDLPGLDRQLLAEIGFGGRPDSNIGQLGYDLEPAAQILGTGGFMALRTSTSAATPTVAQVLRNKVAGDAFRDALAADLRAAGREVATEVYKRTPFGKRFIDIEVSRDGTVLGGIETKVGTSRYHPLQQLKDWYLRYVRGYPVNVARSP